jgi:DNA gyrase subunit A
MGRATQGVRLIKLNDDDRISSVEKIQKIEGEIQKIEGEIKIEGEPEKTNDTPASEEPPVTD